VIPSPVASITHTEVWKNVGVTAGSTVRDTVARTSVAPETCGKTHMIRGGAPTHAKVWKNTNATVLSSSCGE
jgi:hypothetical protein